MSVPAEVLWVYRGATLKARIRRLAGGESNLVSAVLGYPECCVEWELQSERHDVAGAQRAAAVGGAGTPSAPHAAAIDVPAARHELDSVWRTRLALPYLGFNACPHCLARPHSSASAVINRTARELAFALDPDYAHGIWKSALEEAALATTGNCRSLDPATGDSCPCGSTLSYGECCGRSGAVMPEFR